MLPRLGLLCVWVSACAAVPEPCGPASCEGCCGEDGGCQVSSLGTCGAGGSACFDCGALCGDAGCGCATGTCSLSSLPERVDAGVDQVWPRFVDSVGFTARQLGVIVNVDDPASVMVAAYYARARGIPQENVIELHLLRGEALGAESFAPQRAHLLAAIAGRELRALVVTSLTPARVECMSVTSALALGFDRRWCSTPCSPSAPAPALDSGVLPAMMLAGRTVGDSLALIDRGVAADRSFPTGSGFLVRTTDEVRNVRWPDFEDTAGNWGETSIAMNYYDAATVRPDPEVVSNQPDVLFYFTGLPKVPGLKANHYLPGAVADHLTSYGGQVPTSIQMSAMLWLEAGATASYGTVVEPCNYTQKFPKVSVLLEHYYRGEPIVEAYWRSVEEPGEGLFLGEPLASPFGRGPMRFDPDAGTLSFQTTELSPGHRYQVERAEDEAGPWIPVQTLPISGTYQERTVTVFDAGALYRITELP